MEWKHSAYAGEQRSCQSCHMPVVEEDTPIASVLGAPRKGLARHTFVGGNFFMQRMLNRYRTELGVVATAAEMDAVDWTRQSRTFSKSTAELSIERAELSSGRLIADIRMRNLTGHKLPTGYPSRRAWLHVTVRDGAGASCSSRARPAGRRDSRQRQRCRRARRRAAPHRDSLAGSGADLRIGDGRLERTSDDRSSRGCAISQRQPSVPRGFDKSTADAMDRRCRPGRAGCRFRRQRRSRAVRD